MKMKYLSDPQKKRSPSRLVRVVSCRPPFKTQKVPLLAGTEEQRYINMRFEYNKLTICAARPPVMRSERGMGHKPGERKG